MTVAELIEHLSKLNPNLDVYTAIDSEGNGYNSVYYAPSECFATIDNREVTVYSEEDFDDNVIGFGRDDCIKIVVI